ncbi:uncharacterized protein LOC108591695 isoform X2 [Callithrix jacchus]
MAPADLEVAASAQGQPYRDVLCSPPSGSALLPGPTCHQPFPQLEAGSTGPQVRPRAPGLLPRSGWSSSRGGAGSRGKRPGAPGPGRSRLRRNSSGLFSGCSRSHSHSHSRRWTPLSSRNRVVLFLEPCPCRRPQHPRPSGRCGVCTSGDCAETSGNDLPVSRDERQMN